jgi:hypothetical protein
MLLAVRLFFSAFPKINEADGTFPIFIYVETLAEAASEIYFQEQWTRKHQTFGALTAHSMRGDMDRILELGFMASRHVC